MSYSLEDISVYINVSVNRLREEKTKEVVLFFLLCVAINIIGGIDISSRRLLYLDMLGTALAGIALGPWWGASVGLVTNMLLYFMLPSSPSLLVFAIVNILGGLYWGYMCNLKLLKPLEGIASIQKIFNPNELKKAIWFIIISGGIALSVPVLIILKYVLGFIGVGVGLERYIYYVIINITDKLLCVVIATVIICIFFPALASHLASDKPQVSYGASARSVLWFCGLYLVPCCIYFYLYPHNWYLWLFPYVLAILAYFKLEKITTYTKQININLSPITYGALFWLLLSSIATFTEFIYFAVNNVLSKYNIYHVNGEIKYANIIADAFSLSLVIGLIGIVFAVLIQAVKRRENREILRRVEWARDKIATDIHNDPLQLVSVLSRKISTVENQINKTKESLDEIKTKCSDCEPLDMLEKRINDLNKTFSNYYATYLPEVDTSIRRIIKPLSQKDSSGISQVGLLQKIRDLLTDFSERNKAISIKDNFNLTEDLLPQKRSDYEDWKIEVIKILREILNNAEKHSKADTLSLDINSMIVKGKKRLFISISDNGIGFDHKMENINPDSFGLYEIRTRAQDIGASITIEYLYPNKPVNKGTAIHLEIPYDY